MIVAHITGIPVEETVLQLAPAGAAIVTAVAIAGQMSLDRIRRRKDSHSSLDEPKEETRATDD